MPLRNPALLEWLGIESPSGSREKWLGTLGALLGILSVLAVNGLLAGHSQPVITGAMGATAVLLFAVPHGSLSQPWPVLGGHVLSAAIGVACTRLIPAPLISASVAVAAAIFVMTYFRCLHPPGGATALIAVIGGDDIRQLGFHYVWSPVLIDAIILVLVAIAFNYFFKWRRYPAAWSLLDEPPASSLPVEIEHEDIQAALDEIGWVVDITEADIKTLFVITMTHAMERKSRK